jgi:UDP-glucose 4-epimerase
VKIIITGALGHIGSQVCRDLPEMLGDCEIIMLDNLITQRYCSLFDLPKKAKYHFHECDVAKDDLSAFFKNADVVIHLAAMTDAAGSFDRAKIVEENNFNATKTVADACLSHGVKLIHLSSTSVYGTQEETVDENCTPEELQPQSPYAETKLREEDYVRELVQQKGLRAISLRFGTIFGTSIGMRFHTAVNKFCWQAAFNKPITVWRTAYDQKRPYLALDDATRAFAHIIDKNLFDADVYNVLTCNSTVRDIVETIQDYIPKTHVDFVDNKIMNQLSYEVLDDKFKSTGFSPKGSLKNNIAATLKLLGR